MSAIDQYTIDPSKDLVLERKTDVSPKLVWRCWTEPELMVKWFTPAPWKTKSVTIDPRPGGGSLIVMESPEGQEFPNAGCYLEIVEGEKIVFTDFFGAGFSPAAEGFFVGIILIEPDGTGTKYTAIARHKSDENRSKHEAMGFHAGWGAAFDQLVELAKSL